MTNSDVVPLTFEGSSVRLVEHADETWWVLADVCRAMDLSNTSMVAGRLDDDEKGVSTVDTLGGPQQMAIISEPGLYAIIQQSRKPIARRFDRWVRHEVLPTIRRTGRYVAQYDGALVLQQINSRLETIERLTRTKRRIPTDADRRTASRFASVHGGSCPCCRKLDVVDAAGSVINGAQIDHFFQVDRISLKTSWLICGECHKKLTSGLMPREMCHGRFKAYQELLAEWLQEDTGPLFSLDPQPESVAEPARAAAACSVVANPPPTKPPALAPGNDPRQGRML